MSEILYGYCHCGCGQKTSIPTKNDKSKGWVKGVPVKYLKHHNIGLRDGHPAWKGGRRVNKRGYITVYIGNGRVKFEHRILAEQQHSLLPKGAVVHHYGEGKTDNSKLIVFHSNSAHTMHHANERALSASGHAHWRKCKICHQYDDPKNMRRLSNGSHRHHKCGRVIPLEQG